MTSQVLSLPPFSAESLPVPEMLEPFAEALRASIKPYAVYGRLPKAQAPAGVPAQGATRIEGPMDIPADAPWRAGAEQLNARIESFYDGECFMFQLDLGEIPAAVRPAHAPTQGVVWVTMDLSDDWTGSVYFDARPRADIPWLPRSTRLDVRRGWRAELKASLPDITAGVVPTLEWISDARDYWDSMDEWMRMTPEGTGPYHGDLQVGGWCWPVQGDFETRNETFVAGLYGCEFGDAGSLELHYDATEKRWFVEIDTH